MPEPTKVPLLDLQAQYRPLREEILAAITRVADSQRFIMGPEVTALEDELARMLGITHAVAVSSGTDALLLALMALDVKAGDEVITSTYSFFATAGAVARLGATPVLVDIDEATFNVDPEQIAAAITPRTKAIIPVHLFGMSADLDPILDVSSAPRHLSHRRRRAGDRCDLQRQAGRGHRHMRMLFVFPEQESRRIRRCRLVHNERRCAGKARASAAHARHGAEVLPSSGRRQFPNGRDPGGDPPRESAAPCCVDGGQTSERAAVLRAVRRSRRERIV